MAGHGELSKIRISVIMPIHNTGVYLREALESLFAQSFREFELICVDDASSDAETVEILQSFQKAHARMQIQWLEVPVGAAEARNAGFSKARGEYVIFLDADDLFAVDLLGAMYRCICENQADVCVCGYQVFYTENGRKILGGRYIPDRVKVCCAEREEWLLDFPQSPWNKLCRAQFLRENDIYFQTLPSSNDVFFSCMAMILAGKRCFIEGDPLVFYRIKVPTQISRHRNPMDLYRAVILLKDVLSRQQNIRQEWVMRWLSVLLVWNGMMELRGSQDEDGKKQFYHAAASFFKEYPVCLGNRMMAAYIRRMRDLSYESGWYGSPYDREAFLWQMEMVSGQLLEELKAKGRVYLWGCGNRGKAFQQFCKEKGVFLQGVADIRNDGVGGKTGYGFLIISSGEVFEEDALVVASNRRVYRYLKDIRPGLDVLDLEKYCPYTGIVNWRGRQNCSYLTPADGGLL